MATQPHPGKIMILRHAEKPPKHGGEPLDVQMNGAPGGGKSLIVRGWHRAGALNAFFAPHASKPANPVIATPDFIYAASPNDESQRPWETIVPLAAWLNYTEGTPQFNTSYSIAGGEPDLASSVLALDGVVLICWEHDNIMPNMLGAIHAKVPISNFASIPNPFPNVFDLVWVLDLNAEGAGYTWSSVNQNLVAGDVRAWWKRSRFKVSGRS